LKRSGIIEIGDHEICYAERRQSCAIARCSNHRPDMCASLEESFDDVTAQRPGGPDYRNDPIIHFYLR
jgi:hypothetical protein